MKARDIAIALLLLSGLREQVAFAEEQKARVHLYCLSVKVDVGTSELLGESSTLELGSSVTGDEWNDELFPLFDPTSPTHASNFRMSSSSFPTPAEGALALDLPLAPDVNDNGFPDFIESEMAVENERSFGLFSIPVEEGGVTAIWDREAASVEGTLRVTMEGMQFGLLPEFTHRFHILEYIGELTSETGEGLIETGVRLTRTGASDHVLQGTWLLNRVSTNRFNELEFAAGNWTNEAGGEWRFFPGLLVRDEGRVTNYFGFVDFQDGDASTSEPDCPRGARLNFGSGGRLAAP